jgi:hypothetical protein
MKRIFIFGNGNTSFEDFMQHYAQPLGHLTTELDTAFIVCEFRGVDTLVIEFLKTKTENVSVYHIGDRPRYKPDTFKTKAKNWQFVGNFSSDAERDKQAIGACTHFLAIDFNSDSKRKSGTLKNIEKCIELGKIRC